MVHNSVVDNNLNVLFSSDDAYAPHLGVAMYSLLINNMGFESINIYIVDNHISSDNKNKLIQIKDGFTNTRIHWIPFESFSGCLKLDLAWNISLSAYARLFVSAILPQNIQKILYLDCDVIICQSIRTLWESEMYDNIIAAVQDFVGDKTKNAIGLHDKMRYFNSGVLLIDLQKWRDNQIEHKCLQFINHYHGKVVHHDQGVINGVLKNQIQILPISYNLMTIHYIFSRRKLIKYYNDHADFYSVHEVDNAKIMPTILHFTPSFTSRPWIKGCKHPLKSLYWDMIQQTPWHENKTQKNKTKWYIRLVEWRYRVLPY